VFTDRVPDSDEVVRARHARINRLLEEMRASIERQKMVIDKWRAEGILPPEEPRRRF
jgi:hypothetical protein